MVQRHLIVSKLADIADKIERVRKHATGTPEALAANRDALDLVSFNLMLAVQACADIASHLISDEGWPIARNLQEGFTRLYQHGVISEAIALALGKAVGLRNIVAHGYSGVDVPSVYRAATQGVGDLEEFGRQIAQWVEKRANE